jgi:hypothetical protein
MRPARLRHPAGGLRIRNPGARGGKVVGLRADGSPVYASQRRGTRPPRTSPTIPGLTAKQMGETHAEVAYTQAIKGRMRTLDHHEKTLRTQAGKHGLSPSVALHHFRKGMT